MRKPPSLTEVANRIAKHLTRFAAQKAIAEKEWTDSHGDTRKLTMFWRPGAYRAGSRVKVRYVSYQYESSLTRDEAINYLAWLDAGNVGRHYELRSK